jgi:hypothetical protein
MRSLAHKARIPRLRDLYPIILGFLLVIRELIIPLNLVLFM